MTSTVNTPTPRFGSPAQQRPADDQVVLRATDVVVAFGPTTVLPGASLDVVRGEVHLLIGPNGAGKTTFANAITGHVTTRGGTIELDGRPLAGSIHSRALRGIGRKFQVPRVFARLSAAQNLAVAERRAARGAKVAAPELREGIDGGEDVEALSHGQRQRLELAMALAQNPSLVVLDEPTAGMTRSERDQLAVLIRRSAGTQTFLVVEHDMDFVKAVADRVSFMRNGEVIVTGTFDEVSVHPEVLAAYLGEPFSGTPMRQADRPKATQGELVVRGLTVRHGPLAGVRDIAFSLPAGGSLGVIGRNGAGKTTLLDGLMGSLASSGSVQLDGKEIGRLADWDRAQHGMAIVPQGKRLFADLTVAENLRLAELAPAGPGRSFDVHELFPALAPLLGRKAGLLSGGEQQQVAIARALLRKPSVLLLDEPTEGISPIVISQITAVLRHLVGEGLSLVLADQHRSLIEALCDSFVVLRSGDLAGTDDVGSDAFDRYDQRL